MEPLDVAIQNPKNYFNRELSWLDFNKRVLEEANDPTNPLMERLQFLSITSSNLDEFFMIRVAGLLDQVKFNYTHPDTKTQLTAEEQLALIRTKTEALVNRQYALLEDGWNDLAAGNIHFVPYEALTDGEKDELKRYFHDVLFAALTPLGIDAYRPFPLLTNKMIHLFVELMVNEETFQAVVPLSPRFDDSYFFHTDNETRVILLEEIVAAHLHELFEGYTITSVFTFRITRNADLDVEEEGTEDLLSVITDYLQQRKKGMAVRLEVAAIAGFSLEESSIAFLTSVLEIEEREVYRIPGPIDLTFLSKLHKSFKANHPEWFFEPFEPIQATPLRAGSVLKQMEERDLFLHHPYDSFQTVVDFIQEAAKEPNTLAIKQTLYRVSPHSPIITSLKEAAERGVEVTVLVELKARFDEENNVHWAKELEESGAHVLYGVSELKTHSKIALVMKRDGTSVKRYLHLGTGNYNDQTARFYEDMGLLTTDEGLTEDAAKFFHYLSGYSTVPDYQYLSVAPYSIREAFMEEIDKEIAFHKQFGNGRMFLKMNSLTDKKMILKLYEASQAGVQIECIIRGICCLRPGVEGLSETITVRSIVGRFLEHSRVYYFHHNGQDTLILSSADLMTRNMVKRIEIAFPILRAAIKREILRRLATYLNDTEKTYLLGEDGVYKRASERVIGSSVQRILMNEANEQRANEQTVKKPSFWSILRAPFQRK